MRYVAIDCEYDPATDRPVYVVRARNNAVLRGVNLYDLGAAIAQAQWWAELVFARERKGRTAACTQSQDKHCTQ
jgi:hypothetical protein